MAITSEVNVSLLNECFELIPFHGLHKPHENDVIVLPKHEEEEEDNEQPARKDSSKLKSNFMNNSFMFISRIIF